MRARSAAKLNNPVAWKRNQWSIVLEDDLSACVMAEAQVERTGVSNVIRRILAQHYRDHPVQLLKDGRLPPRNGR
jgi:hypothetical protein